MGDRFQSRHGLKANHVFGERRWAREWAPQAYGRMVGVCQDLKGRPAVRGRRQPEGFKKGAATNYHGGVATGDHKMHRLRTLLLLKSRAASLLRNRRYPVSPLSR